MGLLFFLLIITLVLTVHELGHAWVMTQNGVKIKRMGLGFPIGKPIFKFHWQKFPDVTFVIYPIPLGAFVEPTPEGVIFMENLPYKNKADIYGAGPWANIVFACIIWLIVATCFIGNGANYPAYARIAGLCVALVLFRHFLWRYILPFAGLVWFGVLVYLVAQNPLDSVSGPIGIVTIAKKESVSLSSTALFGGYISLMIGLFNMIPIYPLDGGKIIELLFKQRKARDIFRRISIVTILSILVLAFTSDFINLLK
ncbi:site-2 protease family protein [Candidatus Parcubacteria bacterium]|jgi:membrane-associated protease RseP (regulator of RpoE activity)|nr:site-2 protease family protein [Candidatus Parcubacteria bacterium]